MGFIASIILQMHAPALAACPYPNAFDYERIRALRNLSPAHHRAWIKSRPLVGINPSDHADWVMV